MPLRDLIARQLGVKHTGKEGLLQSVIGVTPLQILPNNPNRLAWLILNLSANIIYLGFDEKVSAVNGIRLNANGAIATMVWEEDFDLVGYELWAVAAAAGSQITGYGITEV